MMMIRRLTNLIHRRCHIAVARTRQTRAVTRALAAGEDNRAQALSALPWQAFDPEPELHRPGRWWMDGDEWNIHEIRNLLRWRYGLTAAEIESLLQGGRPRCRPDPARPCTVAPLRSHPEQALHPSEMEE